MENRKPTKSLRSFAELAAEHKLSYYSARTAALKRTFGKVVIIDGRFYVEERKSGTTPSAA